MIFDFDETIIDLEPQHTAAYEALCHALGSDFFQMPREFRFGSGRRIIDDIRAMRDHFDWKQPEHELLALRQELFDDASRNATLELLTGVDRVIRRIHAVGIRMAVTSSAVRFSIEEILRRFELAHCFELIVDGSEVAIGKPDPQAYLVTAERLRVAPSACVVFEDSTVGVRAAKSAGMFCIAVRNQKAQTQQDLSPADVELSGFAELELSWFELPAPPRR